MSIIKSSIKENKQNKSSRSIWHKLILRSLSLGILASLIAGYYLYDYILKGNTQTNGKEKVEIFIPTNATFDQIKDSLFKHDLIINKNSFLWVAQQKKYAQSIKSGRYFIKNGLSNNDLINFLRSGNQEPIKLTFNNIENLQELAEVVGNQIEANAENIIEIINDTSAARQLKIQADKASLLFLPDTYYTNWNTDALSFLKRMKQESLLFWDTTRLEKARQINLTPFEVVILASIVEKESNIPDERPQIAGVYLNRLRKGIRLQADPTIVFAHSHLKDTIKRILYKHLEVDSPYNTYKHAGLPPAPICYPSKSSIEAVLNPYESKNLYFCAHYSLNGRHVFAKTLRHHNRNAAAYRKALNKMRIFK